MDPNVIARINQLAKKQKEAGLSPEEVLEQKELREIYLQSIRGQVKQQLSRIRFTDEER